MFEKEMKILTVRFACVTIECYVLQKVFYKIENWVKCREVVYGFADLVYGSGVWVSTFRNCVKSKDFVCKQSVR